MIHLFTHPPTIHPFVPSCPPLPPSIHHPPIHHPFIIQLPPIHNPSIHHLSIQPSTHHLSVHPSPTHHLSIHPSKKYSGRCRVTLTAQHLNIQKQVRDLTQTSRHTCGGKVGRCEPGHTFVCVSVWGGQANGYSLEGPHGPPSMTTPHPQVHPSAEPAMCLAEALNKQAVAVLAPGPIPSAPGSPLPSKMLPP